MGKLFSTRRIAAAVMVAGLISHISCSDEDRITASKEGVAPEVVQVWPEDGAEIGGVDGDISIAFSKRIDPSSINNQSIVIEPYVQMMRTLVHDTLVEIRPWDYMDYGTEYTITVNRNLRDTDGRRLTEPYSWSFSVRPAVALYVAQGGAGNGSRENPLGSIQTAVDSAGADTTVEIIYVASGDYHESVVVSNRAVIYGSRDPNNNWHLSQIDTSVVYGTSIENHAVAVLVKDVEATVSMRDLKIISRDAGPETSAGSFGVIIQNSTSANLFGCVIQSGAGTDGAPGADGGPTSITKGGKGGRGGYEDGGYYYMDPEYLTWHWVFGTMIPPEPGEQGWCSGGSQSGGAGGQIVSGDGEDGADGADGLNGAGGVGSLQIDHSGMLLLVMAHDGTDGDNGEGGCGGGGGAGDDVRYIGTFEPTVPGYPGGPGGTGGCGGGGGKGGESGGCSIGVFAYNSCVNVNRCLIESGAAGNGNGGGSGTEGGLGEAGRPSNGAGGTGGDGGNGGHGGDGGAGAGGASVAVAGYVSNVSCCHCTFDTGMAGQGGASAANPGEDGVAADMYELGVGPIHWQEF